MESVIEVIFVEFEEHRRTSKEIRCANPHIQQYVQIFRTEYKDNGLLLSMCKYNSKANVIHQTECDYDSFIHKQLHQLPCGYMYEIDEVFNIDNDEGGYILQIVDKEGRPHGLRDYRENKKINWVHGHPESAYDIFIYEHNTTSQGHVYFIPLKDNYYLLDYYYIDCDQEITERMYNIYRLNPEGPVNLVFERNFNHTFSIFKKGSHERYIDYSIGIEFMFDYHITPTEDRRLFQYQKKAVQDYLSAHGFRPEEYNKSTSDYDLYMEFYNRKMMKNEDKYTIEYFEPDFIFLDDEDGEDGEEL